MDEAKRGSATADRLAKVHGAHPDGVEDGGEDGNRSSAELHVAERESQLPKRASADYEATSEGISARHLSCWDSGTHAVTQRYEEKQKAARGELVRGLCDRRCQRGSPKR